VLGLVRLRASIRRWPSPNAQVKVVSIASPAGTRIDGRHRKGNPRVKLRGRTAIVTGSASGIGKALAIGLSKEGAAVAVADIDFANAETAVGEISKQGGNAFAVRVDVSDSASVGAMAKAVLRQFSRVDILVNNAGIVSHYPLLELPEAEWDRVLNTNLKGVLLCVQSVAPSMIESGGGAIINISSVAAEVPTPDYVHYGVSKAGILQLTKSMAVALGPHNIRVNAVQPGPVRTPMNAEILSRPGRWWVRWCSWLPRRRAISQGPACTWMVGMSY
jgi:NAD(P)-dependent dehydrogenase (short-subunit alcohol dehydrogenase family)